MTVLQIDREAAANLLCGAAPDGLLAGRADTLSLVQTLAAHREQATVELVEALIALRDLRNGTDMTHEDAYDSMFKSGGRDAWQMLDAALTKANGDG